MHDVRYPPNLKLEKTVSHPVEPVRVVGFTGRDVKYGSDAVLLKAIEMPVRYEVDDSGEEILLYGIFEEAADLMEDGSALYVLGPNEKYVYAIPPSYIDEAEVKSFNFYGEPTFYSIQLDEEPVTKYPESEVGVP